MESNYPTVVLRILVLLLILAPLTACGTFDSLFKIPDQARETDLVTVEVVATTAPTITTNDGTAVTITVLPTDNIDLTTPRLTPTRTRQPTTTPTETPKPTLTRTLQPTPLSTSTPDMLPQIVSFTATPNPIGRGGTVTLSWNARDVTNVGITRLSPEGDIFLETEAFNLPTSGSITLTVPDEYTERVKYYLGARDANDVIYKATITIDIVCRYDEYMAHRCPLTQNTTGAAYESFERGHMVWRSDTREIYVLYADGGYEIYVDSWNEGDPVDVPGSPSPGLYEPVRGFGNLYAHQPRVRERLGWATVPEAGYTMRVETIHGGSGRYRAISTYFTLPDNRVVNLYPFTSTWEIVPK